MTRIKGEDSEEYTTLQSLFFELTGTENVLVLALNVAVDVYFPPAIQCQKVSYTL